MFNFLGTIDVPDDWNYELGSPIPLQVPANAPVIIAGTPAISGPTGAPIILKFVLGGILGSSCTFTYTATKPVNLGIYGPNPTILGIGPDGKTTGRMRAPKSGDAASGSCTGNFTVGTYYLVFRTGDNSPPIGNISVNISTGWWVWW